ncbi:DUF1570 domain-containing protein [Tundrisphaera sp. TA3]|uniref:DUF1570 domain-containing protein n=1 Tax=Tundrisphaera sp. TA3 TaxID=3435775 RepID=UPI003EBCB3E9
MRAAWIAFALGIGFVSPPAPARAQVPAPPVDAAEAGGFRKRSEAILAREADRISALSVRLRNEGDAKTADAILGPDLPAVRDGSTRFVPLPPIVPAPAPPGETPPGAKEAEAIRDEAAAALVDLAGEAARSRPPAYAVADSCLRAALERKPDHPEARRLLGFVSHEGGWATPHALAMKANRWVDDATFGWVPENWVPHLRQGELPEPGATGRWLPAAEADERHRDWANRWSINTEHFEIGTNMPLAEAISFGRKLEILHELYFSIAADLVVPERLPLALRYAGKEVKPTPAGKRHRVYYFATLDEYARHVAPVLGDKARASLGLYVPRKDSKTLGLASYFFNDVGGQLPIEATLFHEGSHQLLFETGGLDHYGQNQGNYWVFEGFGTYFETLTLEPDGSVRIGGLVGPRIERARARLLDGGEFIPIKDLVAMDKWRFNTEPAIYLHYAESMALAVFLMQAEGGRYREGFLDYVQDAYRGRLRNASGRSLESRLGRRYADLDREFLDYLRPR